MVIALATVIFNVKMLFYFQTILSCILSSDGLSIVNSFGLCKYMLLVRIYQMVMLDFCITWYKF